jgi:hypothetical protein
MDHLIQLIFRLQQKLGQHLTQALLANRAIGEMIHRLQLAFHLQQKLDNSYIIFNFWT